MKLEIKKMLIFILTSVLILLLTMIGFEAYTYITRVTIQDPLVLESEDTLKIGLSLGTLKEDRWVKDSELLQAKAAGYGVELITLNANNDDNDQLTQVKYLLDQGIDVLMIVPNDFENAVEAVQLAKSRGIPVISYDRLVRNANVDLYISFDNVKVGQLMAERIVQDPSIENLLIVNGAKTDYNTKLIKEGYDSVLKPYIDSGKIKLIDEQWAPNWVREYAFEYTEGILKEKIPLDAVIAGNDSLAEAVYEALSEYRVIHEVTLVGQDADLTACQRIVEGTQAMTVYKPIEELVTTAIEMSILLANGKPFKAETKINDGIYNVNCVLLNPIAVDANNMDKTVVQDGFHLKESIYRE